MLHMKNIICTLFIAAMLPVLFSGCASAPSATTIFGTECRALSDAELEKLIGYTRAALKKHERKYNFTDVEKRIISAEKPQIYVEYRGDCFGTLMIYWRTPARRIGMRIEDHFNAFPPSCAMIIGSNNGEITTGVKPDKSRRGR